MRYLWSHRFFISAFVTCSLLLRLNSFAQVVIDGTDANDHGSVAGGVNQAGWRYMQKVLEAIAPRITTTNRFVVDLGTDPGTQARNAIDSAFNLSALPPLGWTMIHLNGTTDIVDFLSGNTVAGITKNDVGILYLATSALSGGDISLQELSIINSNGAVIAEMVNVRGMGLFAMGEGSAAGAYGWLLSVIPTITSVSASATGLGLTQDGTNAFPGLTDADLSTGPWHNYFTGNFGSLQVLAFSVQNTNRPVILGGLAVATLQLISFSLSSTSAIGSDIIIGTLTMNVAVPSDTTIVLSNDNPAVIVPSNVVVRSGQFRATFPIETLKVSNVTTSIISATYDRTLLVGLRIAPDTTPPNTTITSGPPNGLLCCTNTAEFCYMGTDDHTLVAFLNFQWRIDGGEWQGPFMNQCVLITNLSEGQHTFEVAAIDDYGNLDPTPASRPFTVDTVPPQIIGLSAAPAANQSEITWITDEPTRGTVEYGLSGNSEFTNRYAGPPLTSHRILLTGLVPETTYFFRVLAQDVAGNVASAEGTAFVTLAAPDLVVSNLTLGGVAPLLTGDQVTVDWTDVNLGRAPVTQPFSDRLVVSNATTAQVLLDTLVFYNPASAGNGAIGVGEQRARQFTFRLPDGFPGAGTIDCHVTADVNDDVFEYASGHGAEANNTAVVTRVSSLRPYPDLIVTNIVAPVETYTERSFNVAWTVCNRGPAAAAGNWVDRIYLSSDEQAGNDRLLAEFPFSGSLASGECFTRVQSLSISRSGLTEGQYHLVVVTDAGNAVFELTNETNNATVDAEVIQLRFSPQPNLQVSLVQAPTNAFSSQQTVVEWVVTNAGNGSTGAAGWQDAVWLSTDAFLDGGDTFLGQAQNASFLNAGDSYRGSLTVTLPRGIDGDYFMIVKVDANNQVNEFADENDNLNSGPTHITLTPPPDLRVAAVIAPASAFSGQPIIVSWSITNSGPGRTLETSWQDQVFLSRTNAIDGTAVLLGTEPHAGALNSGEEYTVANRSVTLPIGISGAFYLVVRADAFNNVFEHVFEGNNVGGETTPTVVNLTPPPDLEVVQVVVPVHALASQPLTVAYRVANNGATATPNTSWNERWYLSADATVSPATDLLLGNRTHSGALDAGQSYSNSFTATLPAGLTGLFYALVQIDAGDEVFELVKTNNIGLSSGQITIEWLPPDLAVESVTAPTGALASRLLTVSYRVANLGETATPNTSWNERWYLSADPVLQSDGDLLLGSRTHFGPLESGQSYTDSFTATLPDTLTGAYYALVQIDAPNEVLELIKANNTGLSAAPIAIESRPADLVVSTLTAPVGGKAGSAIPVSWTVRNDGTGDTVTSRWTDRLVISSDAVPGNGDDVVLLDRPHDGLLAHGASYTVNGQSVALPLTLTPGNYRLFLLTDSTNDVYEAAAENNNISVAVLISINRETGDLRVTRVTVPATVQGGQAYTIAWSVENAGAAGTFATYWSDAVYFSTDATFDAADTLIGMRQHSNELPPGDAYTNFLAYAFPLETAGDYYIIVLADSDNRVLEPGAEANNSLASTNAIRVTRAPLPDLAITSLVVPTEAFSGQSIELTWTVRNLGAGAATGNWYDAVYLSLDQLLDRGTDVYAGFADRPRALPSGEEYVRTARFNVPAGLVGPFYVFIAADSGAVVNEGGVEANNVTYGATAMLVRLQPPADLVVGAITIPTNAVVGQSVTLTYTVRNLGANTASGSWMDSIYFSADETWDLDDALFARVTHTGTVTPGGSYSETVTAPLPGLVAGNYHVIIRSDILNHIPESNETNNFGGSLDQVAIDVEELRFAVPVAGNIRAGQSLFYRFDAEAGHTVRLRFSAQLADAAIELYVRYGRTPTRGQFDFAANDPFATAPVLTLPIEQSGRYYVLAYVAQGDGNFTIVVEDLPFSVETASPVRVGNNGLVTLEIMGALFASDTTFQLFQTTNEIYAAVASLVPNSVAAYATMDVIGAPEGTYHLRALRGNGEQAVLSNAVMVVAGGDPHVAVNLDAPLSVRPGRQNLFTVQYGNDGDVDMVAPLLLLESRNRTPLGVSAESARPGPLHLLGAALEGPPDILRPGAFHSISVYFESSTSGVDIRIRAINGDDAQPVEDWQTISQAVRPNAVPSALWEPFWAGLEPRLGPTWGDYVRLLNRLSRILSPPGRPLRDVRQIFAELYARNPSFRPASVLNGRLLDAVSGQAVAGAIVTAQLRATNSPGRGYETVSDASGGFVFPALLPGIYDFTVEGYHLDLNRDGQPDEEQSGVTVTDSVDVTGVVLYAFAQPLDTPLLTQDTEPALWRDSGGRLHLLWLRDGRYWHAVNEGTTWTQAAQLPDAVGRSGRIVGDSRLIDGVREGLLAIWSGGEGNASELYYTVGQLQPGGGYQWTLPGRLTTNAIYDGGLDATADTSGRPVLFWQKENYAIDDDADNYSQRFAIINPQFVEPVGLAQMVTGGQGAAGTHRIRLARRIGNVTIPSWVPFIGGSYEAEYRLVLAGQIDCTLFVQGGGEFKLKVGKNGEVVGLGNGQARWDAYEPCRCYKFADASLTVGVQGAINVPLTDFSLGPFASIKIGPRLEAAGTARFTWTAQDSFPSLPSAVSGNFRVGLGGNGEGKVWIPFLGDGKLTGRVIGSVNFMVDRNGFALRRPNPYTVSFLGRAEFTVLGAIRFVDYAYTWPGQDIGPASASGVPPGMALSYLAGADTGSANDYSAAGAQALTLNLSDDGKPAITKAPDGQIYAAWADQNGIAFVVYNSVSGQWSPPFHLPGSGGRTVSDTALATDGDGDVIAVWASADLSNLNASSAQEEIWNSFLEGGDLVYARRDSQSGVWSTPQPLFTLNGPDQSVSLARTADGNVVAAWHHVRPAAPTTLYAAIWSRVTKSWSPTTAVSTSYMFDKAAASSLGATPILVWAENPNPGTNDARQLRQLTSSTWDGVSWSAPQALAFDFPALLAASFDSAGGGFLPSPPDECFKCEKINHVTQGSGNCVVKTEFDEKTCTETTVYEPCVVVPRDPNDILGPEGFGPERWTAGDVPLRYTIRFENDPVFATAPAQEVFITQQLDPDLDFRTFRLGDFGFGDLVVDVPENRAFYNTRLDLRETLGLFVDVSAGIDVATGMAFWQLTSIDPATGDPPANALLGFLPPNLTPPEGEGFVTYSVRPRSGGLGGARIDAFATIIFDTQGPIETPPIFNTLDVSAPVSAVQPLIALETNVTFLISWSGGDPAGGSAIASYDIFVSTDDGTYELLLANTADISAYFTGERGRQYAFYSIARDNAGNREVPPSTADAVTRISDNIGPVLAPIANYVVPVGGALLVTNNASDANIPSQSLRFSLSVAPSGATIRATNGVLHWTPQRVHAGSNYTLTVLVTDDGVPSLTSAQSFIVTVPDYVEVAVGRTAVGGGEMGALPIRVFSSTTLTSLVFALDLPSGRLLDPTIIARSPQIDSAEAQFITDSQWVISLGAATPLTLPGGEPLVTLGFRALDVPPSAFLPLSASGIRGIRSDGSIVPTAAGLPGQVAVVISSGPLAEMSRETNGRPQLVLFGNPATRYAVESSPTVNPAVWSVWWEGQLTGYIQSFSDVATNGSAQFFRVRTVPPSSPR